MAHQVLMESVKNVPMESLPLINWKEASLAVNGDEEGDDAFLLELLATFYHETVPRVQRILNAAISYRANPAAEVPVAAGNGKRSVEKVFKDEAHAIKGSSANIRLWRLAKAAEALETPFKHLLSREPYPITDAERTHLLDTFCVAPCTPLLTLAEQFKDFVRFMEQESRKEVDPSLDLTEVLEPKTLAELNQVTLAHYAEHVERPCADFWRLPVPGADRHTVAGAGSSADHAAAPAPAVAAAAAAAAVVTAPAVVLATKTPEPAPIELASAGSDVPIVPAVTQPASSSGAVSASSVAPSLSKYAASSARDVTEHDGHTHGSSPGRNTATPAADGPAKLSPPAADPLLRNGNAPASAVPAPAVPTTAGSSPEKPS